MTERGRPDVEAVLSGLKPFQRDTVEHVFHQLYLDPDSSRRFLVADEVGLGKTLVARGVIAKAIEHQWNDIDRIDVVYICSNGHIARQNLNRLNVIGDGAAVHASRITLLPLQLAGLRGNKVNFVSFTPGTSLEMSRSMGMWRERVLLYCLLREAWGLGNAVAPKNLFQGGVSQKNTSWFRRELKDMRRSGTIDQGLAEAFAGVLEKRVADDRAAGRPDFRERFGEACERFGYSRKRIPPGDRRIATRLIGELRYLLAESCISALEPDLVILDEFQRFKNLLGDDDDAGRLAKNLFSYSDATTDVRVLLLSATPYKMYTLYGEAGGEEHHADFLHTLSFLLNDDQRLERARELLTDFRRRAFRIADEGTGELCATRDELQALLRQVMVRTERLASSSDGNGMLRAVPPDTAAPSVGEVRTYPALQTLADHVGGGAQLEYWKSAPFLLNFMHGYQIKRRFDKHREQGDPHLLELLNRLAPSLISWSDIEAYAEIDPDNVRLRTLLRDTLGGGQHQLLWLPPSMPYYCPGGPFSEHQPRNTTKRLVFSAWVVVPRVVAALLSYEAERKVVADLPKPIENTAEARRRRPPLLRFAITDDRLTGMPVLGMIYPSFTLARLGDVLALANEPKGGDLLSREQLVELLTWRLEPELQPILKRHGAASGPEDESWYWAAPILLDLAADEGAVREWLAQPGLVDLWSGAKPDDDPDTDSRWKDHVEEARKLLEGSYGLGQPPADLAVFLAELALAGPAVTALRALARAVGSVHLVSDPTLRTAAGRVGWGFRSLFNRQEATTLVRSIYEGTGLPFWRQTLRYSADGVLQAVLDEYAHVLRDALGFVNHARQDVASAIADEILEALTLRTATTAVDEVTTGEDKVDVTRRRMRLRFAVPFGNQRDEAREGIRSEQVRSAFNSPFQPFVLVSTSVGQEGLDFHQYCHAVVHWNLPANPVDLEQREGRVHRYKGHAVRKNVAARFAASLDGHRSGDVWDGLFRLASADVSDDHRGMVPYWVYDPEGGCRIERHVPALPMSRDLLRYEDLKRSLAVYRMVFGQPRQEDLVSYLVEHVSEEGIEVLAEVLQVRLGPGRRDPEKIPEMSDKR